MKKYPFANKIKTCKWDQNANGGYNGDTYTSVFDNFNTVVTNPDRPTLSGPEFSSDIAGDGHPKVRVYGKQALKNTANIACGKNKKAACSGVSGGVISSKPVHGTRAGHPCVPCNSSVQFPTVNHREQISNGLLKAKLWEENRVRREERIGEIVELHLCHFTTAITFEHLIELENSQTSLISINIAALFLSALFKTLEENEMYDCDEAKEGISNDFHENFNSGSTVDYERLDWLLTLASRLLDRLEGEPPVPKAALNHQCAKPNEIAEPAIFMPCMGCGQFGHDEENCDLVDTDDDDDDDDDGDDNNDKSEIHPPCGKNLFDQSNVIPCENGHTGKTRAQNVVWLQEIAESYLCHFDITITFALLREYDRFTPNLSPDTVLAFCGVLIDNLDGYESQVRIDAKLGLYDLIIELNITDLEVDCALFEHLLAASEGLCESLAEYVPVAPAVMEQVRVGLTRPSNEMLYCDVIGDAIWSIDESDFDCSIESALWRIDCSRCTRAVDNENNCVDYGRSEHILATDTTSYDDPQRKNRGEADNDSNAGEYGNKWSDTESVTLANEVSDINTPSPAFSVITAVAKKYQKGEILLKAAVVAREFLVSGDRKSTYQALLSFNLLSPQLTQLILHAFIYGVVDILGERGIYDSVVLKPPCDVLKNELTPLSKGDVNFLIFDDILDGIFGCDYLNEALAGGPRLIVNQKEAESERANLQVAENANSEMDGPKQREPCGADKLKVAHCLSHVNFAVGDSAAQSLTTVENRDNLRVLWDRETIEKVLKQKDWEYAIAISRYWENAVVAHDQLDLLETSIKLNISKGVLPGMLDRCLKCLCLDWIHTATPPDWVCINCDPEGQLCPIYLPPESIPIATITECLTSMEVIATARLKGKNGKSNLSALAPIWKPDLKSVAVTHPSKISATTSSCHSAPAAARQPDTDRRKGRKLINLCHFLPLWQTESRADNLQHSKRRPLVTAKGSLLWRRHNVPKASHLPIARQKANVEMSAKTRKTDDPGINDVITSLDLNVDLAKLSSYPSLYMKGRKCVRIEAARCQVKQPKTARKVLTVAARTRSNQKVIFTDMIRRTKDKKCPRAAKPWENGVKLDRQSLAKLQMCYDTRLEAWDPMTRFLAEGPSEDKQRAGIEEDKRKAQDHINARIHSTHKPTLTYTAIVTPFVIAFTIEKEKDQEGARRKKVDRGALGVTTPPKATKYSVTENQVVSSQHNLLPLFLSLKPTTLLLHSRSGGF